MSIEVWLLGLSWAHVRCRPVTGVGACSGCLSRSGDLGCHHTLVWLQGLAAGVCVALEAGDGSWRQWPAGAGCQHVQLCRPVTSQSLMWALAVGVHMCGCRGHRGRHIGGGQLQGSRLVSRLHAAAAA